MRSFLQATFLIATSSLVSSAYAKLDLTFSSPNPAHFARNVNPLDDRPPECPPCFNCNLADFHCHQFGKCNQNNGKCQCPPGYGGEDCKEPLCGSLAQKPEDRPLRKPDEDTCKCEDGWSGINCNVCQTDNACNAFTPEGKDGVCYKQGLVQKQNFQMCDITNRKILDTIKPQIPQATFSCTNETAECNFQCKRKNSRYKTRANESHSLGRPERIILLCITGLLPHSQHSRRPQYH